MLLNCHILIITDFSWMEGELCEVNVLLENPLPIELKVSSMVSTMVCCLHEKKCLMLYFFNSV